MADLQSSLDLKRWIKGFATCDCSQPLSVKVNEFSETGRGLMALESCPSDCLLVRVPLAAVVTRFSALTTNLSNLISVPDGLRTHTLLAAWLVTEIEKEVTSWRPYLNSLPKFYTTPFFLPQEIISCLPGYITRLIAKQKRTFERDFEGLRRFIPHLDRDRFTWAWFTVNTRAVYLDKDPREEACRNFRRSTEPADHLALVPFLDLLNHSSGVSIEAGLNISNQEHRCDGGYFYEIVSKTPVTKNSQAFICYGPHSNTKLWIEYGFIINPRDDDVISLELDDVLEYCESDISDADSLSLKVQFLQERGLHDGLYIDRQQGLSWGLIAIINVLQESQSGPQHWQKAYDQTDDSKPLSQAINRFLTNFKTRLEGCLSSMAASPSGMASEAATCIREAGHQLVKSHLAMIKSHLD